MSTLISLLALIISLVALIVAVRRTKAPAEQFTSEELRCLEMYREVLQSPEVEAVRRQLMTKKAIQDIAEFVGASPEETERLIRPK